MKLFTSVLAALSIAATPLVAGAANDQATPDRFEDVCELDTRHVYFGYNETRLDKSGLKRVAAAAACLTDGPLKGEDIILMGHAGPIGDEKDNYVIAERRANAVKAALVKSGVSPLLIHVLSAGETHENRHPDTKKGNEKARRVSILRNLATPFVPAK